MPGSSIAKACSRLQSPVGGEFVIKQESGSEITHGNAASRNGDQAQQGQAMMHRRVALAWLR
jgi:hypothetical protein